MSSDDSEWRTVSPPNDELTDALCLHCELWKDRCYVGYGPEGLDVSARYEPTPDQLRRLTELDELLREAIPFFVPTRRTVSQGQASTFVAFDISYGSWLSGWN